MWLLKKIPVIGLYCCCSWWGYWVGFIDGFLSTWARWVWGLMALRSRAWPVSIRAHLGWNPSCSSCLAVLWLTVSCFLKRISHQLSRFLLEAHHKWTPLQVEGQAVELAHKLQGMWGLIQHHLENLSAWFFLCWAHLVCVHPALKVFTAASYAKANAHPFAKISISCGCLMSPVLGVQMSWISQNCSFTLLWIWLECLKWLIPPLFVHSSIIGTSTCSN